MERQVCSVCYEDKNKIISCFHCAYKACKACCEQYMIQSTIEPHCMQCRTLWTCKFLSDNFTKQFINTTLKNHREKILFDRERSMLPATQIYVERYRIGMSLTPKIEELDIQINHLIDKRRMLSYRQKRLMNGIPDDNENETNGEGSSKESKNFVRKCPNNECLGFLSTRWKCCICDCNVCSECHEIKDPNNQHTCNPDMVATAKLLAKESKPCPKCGALCYKIDGCDQVFAMCCATTFSWRTGKIETGRIHAPDYFTWLQRNGKDVPRHPLDIPCGGLPDILFIRMKLKEIEPKIEQPILQEIYMRHRILSHILVVELPSYLDGNDVPLEEENRHERVKYMLGNIDENKFKKIIQQKDKARKKKKDISIVLNTIITIGSDIMNRLVNMKSRDEIMNIMPEFDSLRDYTNDIMRDMSKIYSCVTPRIPDNWERVIKLN